MAEEIDCAVRNEADKFQIVYRTKDRSLKKVDVYADWQQQGYGHVFTFQARSQYTHTSSVVPTSTVQKLANPSVSVDSGDVVVVLKKKDRSVEDITPYFE